MGAVTPGETLGTLYNIHVGSNKTKQHTLGGGRFIGRGRERERRRRRRRSLFVFSGYYRGTQGARC